MLVAADVILFVREAFERMPSFRSEMMSQLLGNFGTIQSGEVCRATLWIVGEYALSLQDIKATFQCLRCDFSPRAILFIFQKCSRTPADRRHGVARSGGRGGGGDS